jgi:predicted Rossmann-fold nucleotide-binding protein
MKLERVISGGQTGVDRGALDAAMLAGIPVGGACPKGRKAEDGLIPDRYPLTELASENYRVRTEKNVKDADATLILTVGAISGGIRRGV